MTNREKERPKYSVILILEEKSSDFINFIEGLHGIFEAAKEPFEILIIANGTEGHLKNELPKINDLNGRVKAFVLNKKTTQAVCLQAALKESIGEIIVVCGSYQQIKNESFNTLLDALDDKTDIISPWRQKRVDPIFNQFQSKIFNLLSKKITGIDIHDLSCTVKIFRREVLENTRLYGNMYRFLPIVAAQKGYRNKEVKCEHHKEKGKTGFYRLSEYVTRIIDIFTVFFTTRFVRKPLRFFSAIGFFFLMLGIGLLLYSLFLKIFLLYPIGEQFEILLAILFMVIGIQAASVGLFGEIFVFTYGRKTPEYTIEKLI